MFASHKEMYTVVRLVKAYNGQRQFYQDSLRISTIRFTFMTFCVTFDYG